MNIDSIVLPDRAALVAYLSRLLDTKVNFSNAPAWRAGEERSIEEAVPAILKTAIGFQLQLVRLHLEPDLNNGSISKARPIGANYALLPIAGITGSYSNYSTPNGTMKAIAREAPLMIGATYSEEPGGSTKADRVRPILTRAGENFSGISTAEPYIVAENLTRQWLTTTQTPYPPLVGARGDTFELSYNK